MADQTKLTVAQQAELALVQLGGQSRGQAAVMAAALTPPEQLAAASCHQQGDKLRLIDLLDHVATRQHLEADFAAFSTPAFQEATHPADPDDPTDTE